MLIFSLSLIFLPFFPFFLSLVYFGSESGFQCGSPPPSPRAQRVPGAGARSFHQRQNPEGNVSSGLCGGNGVPYIGSNSRKPLRKQTKEALEGRSVIQSSRANPITRRKRREKKVSLSTPKNRQRPRHTSVQILIGQALGEKEERHFGFRSGWNSLILKCSQSVV